MKKKISRGEAVRKIEEFFKRGKLDRGGVRKIKRLAMLYNIKLGVYRKRFCKKCFGDLRGGNVKISKHYKTVVCGGCGERNKFKIS